VSPFFLIVKEQMASLKDSHPKQLPVVSFKSMAGKVVQSNAFNATGKVLFADRGCRDQDQDFITSFRSSHERTL